MTYTKQHFQRLRDEMLSKKASDTLPFTEEGNIFRFACDLLLEDCDPGFIQAKTFEYARVDTLGVSYGLIHRLIFGHPIILSRYLNSIFSIIVNWRLTLMDQEILTNIEDSIKA